MCCDGLKSTTEHHVEAQNMMDIATLDPSPFFSAFILLIIFFAKKLSNSA
jgi:hypothetical protein